MAADSDRVLGTWLTPKYEDRYCGTIAWMKTSRNDDKNAGPALRSRPLAGEEDSLEVRVSAGPVKRTLIWTRVK